MKICPDCGQSRGRPTKTPSVYDLVCCRSCAAIRRAKLREKEARVHVPPDEQDGPIPATPPSPRVSGGRRIVRKPDIYS